MRSLTFPRTISIHALREEGDTRSPSFMVVRSEFLSTPSARRATSCSPAVAIQFSFLSTPSARRATREPTQLRCHGAISIHALREEGDLGHFDAHNAPANFYPRPPRGGRLPPRQGRGHQVRFLSTPSARRATGGSSGSSSGSGISIHALREEGDLQERLSLP